MAGAWRAVALDARGGANGYTIEVRSPGLWRIQAEPDDSYLDTIFAEERTVLVDMLDDMGVTVTDRPDEWLQS